MSGRVFVSNWRLDRFASLRPRANMIRFLFDLYKEGIAQLDTEGSELASVEAAIEEAHGCLPDVARDGMSRGRHHHSFGVIVRNEGGKTLYAATLTYEGFRVQPAP